jgi:hypothetical protein
MAYRPEIMEEIEIGKERRGMSEIGKGTEYEMLPKELCRSYCRRKKLGWP